MSKETEELIELIGSGKNLTTMLAPSFPIIFSYPEIVGKLKRLGFKYVVETAVGAQKTNEILMKMLKENPKSKFITSPCASFSQMIKTKYPELLKYLTPVHSPMYYTAEIVKEKWPDTKPVFIGPCIVKKLEASNYTDIDILVITFKELNEILQYFKSDGKEEDVNYYFDMISPTTRLYPISGGLTQSANLHQLLTPNQIQVVSGWQNCIQALDNFEKNTEIRLLDILYCDGGCINGSGIESKLNTEERRDKKQ